MNQFNTSEKKLKCTTTDLPDKVVSDYINSLSEFERLILDEMLKKDFKSTEFN